MYCQAPPGGAEAPPAPESEEPKPAANPVSKDPRFMRFFKMLQVVGSAVECFSSPEHKLLFIISSPEHNIFVVTVQDCWMYIINISIVRVHLSVINNWSLELFAHNLAEMLHMLCLQAVVLLQH